MMLHRLMDHVRTQNWLAVVLDFAIVVFGVYIGIALGNWNAAREEAEREASILERLQDDFAQLEYRDGYAAATAEQGYRGAHFFIERIEDGTLDQYAAAIEEGRYDPALMLDMMQAVLSVQPPNGPSSTYVEIVSSGQVSLLEDAELRNMLAIYDSSQQQYQDVSDSMRDLSFEVVMPLWKAGTFADTVGDDGRVVMGGLADFDFAALSGEPAYYTALQSARRIMGTHYQYTERLASLSQQISMRLEEATGEPPADYLTAMRDSRETYRARAAEMSAADQDGDDAPDEADANAPVPEEATPDGAPSEASEAAAPTGEAPQ